MTKDCSRTVTTIRHKCGSLTRVLVLAALAILSVATGCSHDGLDTVYPVSGQVTLDGTPLAAVSLTLLLGCSPDVKVPSTVPARGIVKIRGKPASGIRVKLYSQNSAKNQGYIPTGESGPDGAFALSTGAPLNGAPPGTYVVTFERPIIDPRNPIETEIDGLGDKYNDPARSKWVVTVGSTETSFEPFELEE